MDIKVFNTNLIRFVLIFNHIDMNGIMMNHSSKFHKFTFLCFLLFHPEIQMKGALFCSLGIYIKPFPIRQYFDEVAG